MLNFIQSNWGTLAALAVVAFIVFLSVRRMLLDKKAGIGACDQKCATCAKMEECRQNQETEKMIEEAMAPCSGACSKCKYASSCRGGN